MKQLKKPITVRFVLVPVLSDIQSTLEQKQIRRDEDLLYRHNPSKTQLRHFDGTGIGWEAKYFSFNTTKWQRPDDKLLSDTVLFIAKVPRDQLSHDTPPGDYDFENVGRTVRVCSSLRSQDVFISTSCFEDIMCAVERLRDGNIHRIQNSHTEYEQLGLSLKVANSDRQAYAEELMHHSAMFYSLFYSFKKSLHVKLFAWIVRHILRKYFDIEIVLDKKHVGAVEINDLNKKRAERYTR